MKNMKIWGKVILAICIGIGVLWMAGDQTIKWLEKQEQKEQEIQESSESVLQQDVTVEEPKDSSKGESPKETGESSKDDPLETEPLEEENLENQTPKRVALTFDDGPHPTYTEELLDGLKERNVKATFFVLGEHAQLYPELIERMKEEGHLIGNHTYSHLQLKDNNWEEYRAELIKTNEVIWEITGEEVTYVRPPYGSWDKSFEEELNMFPVLWTVDSRDWCSKDAAGVTKKVVKETEEGDIILMHDYYASTVKAALATVDELKAKGYTFVTVEEMLFD